MRIKRFLAPDMRQALRMVREDQGPDAAVVSSRRTDAGIELLVALDYDEQLVTEMGAAAPAAGLVDTQRIATPSIAEASCAQEARQPSLPASPSSDHQAKAPSDAALGAMSGELRKLWATLEQQLHLLAKQDGDPVAAELLSRGERLGLERSLVEELIDAARKKGYPQEQLWSGLREALKARIAVVGEDLVSKGGVFALIGPTGVGKTTTVAKLAARFALRYGRRHVALITTDTYRIGAREQLLTFGELLGIPVDSASSRDELGRLLQEHARKRLVLIDNAGLSPRDLRLAAQLSDLDCIPLIKTYLVVSAGIHPAGLDEDFRVFSRARLQGCIVTKLDEAVTLGPMLGALARHQVPLVYACDGQRVPEDIHPAAKLDLVQRAEALAVEIGAESSRPQPSTQHNRAANGRV